MSDYASLQTLLALHRHGSLTAAARALNSPKSTLSRRLAVLEGELGYRLTRTEHGRLLLTDAGKCYLEYSEKIVTLFEEGRRALHSASTEPRGSVHVRICPDMSSVWAANVFCGFLSQHPDIRLDVRAIGAAGIAPEGDGDMWLGCAAPGCASASPVDGLEHIALGEWRRRLYVSARQPQWRDALRDIGDVDRLQWISKSDECDAVALRHAPSGGSYRLQPAARLRVDSLLMQADAIASGGGIGILPSWMAECPRHGLKDKFIAVLPDWQAPPVRLSLFLRKGSRAKRVKVLVNYLQEQLPPRWRLQQG